MVRLDRYILSQLMGPFGLFALILIGVYWLNRALGIFDQLIGDGHSARAFLELVLLFLPQVVAIVLPVVAFAASVYVSNRLHSDSEFVVFLAAGLSPFRLARPFMIFSLMVAILAGILSHYLVPVSRVEMSERQQELAEDMAAQLIVEGTFLHPIDGVTFYIRKIDPNGELFDIFLYDQRGAERSVTYTSQRALLLRQDDAAQLIMFDGLIQSLDLSDNRLSKIHFDDFVFDMSSLVRLDEERPKSIDDFSTLEALSPTLRMQTQTNRSRANFQFIAHDRIIQPIHVFVFPLIGMAALMLGGFSRFGVARQIVLSIVIIVGLSLTIGPLQSMVRQDISNWPLLYLPDIVGLILALTMLSMATRNGRHRRLGLRRGSK